MNWVSRISMMGMMSLRGLDSFRYAGSFVQYGEGINDIKFEYYNNTDLEYISIKKEVWYSIAYSFKLSQDEVQELTMWSIGDDPNLKDVPTNLSVFLLFS